MVTEYTSNIFKKNVHSEQENSRQDMFILLIVVCAYANAYLRMQPWQHADASTIACLHHHLLAYCAETSKIVREQVSMTEYTSHMFNQMLVQCFASNRISVAEIKARPFYIAIRKFLCVYSYAYMRMPPWQHAHATMIACLHHYACASVSV